jgi:hypothetical protein
MAPATITARLKGIEEREVLAKKLVKDIGKGGKTAEEAARKLIQLQKANDRAQRELLAFLAKVIQVLARLSKTIGSE